MPEGSGYLVEARSVIDVDVVEAHGGMADQDLALTRIADLRLFPFELVGTAGLMEADGVAAHGVFSEAEEDEDG